MALCAWEQRDPERGGASSDGSGRGIEALGAMKSRYAIQGPHGRTYGYDLRKALQRTATDVTDSRVRYRLLQHSGSDQRF